MLELPCDKDSISRYIVTVASKSAMRRKREVELGTTRGQISMCKKKGQVEGHKMDRSYFADKGML